MPDEHDEYAPPRPPRRGERTRVDGDTADGDSLGQAIYEEGHGFIFTRVRHAGREPRDAWRRRRNTSAVLRVITSDVEECRT